MIPDRTIAKNNCKKTLYYQATLLKRKYFLSIIPRVWIPIRQILSSGTQPVGVNWIESITTIFRSSFFSVETFNFWNRSCILILFIDFRTILEYSPCLAWEMLGLDGCCWAVLRITVPIYTSWKSRPGKCGMAFLSRLLHLKQPKSLLLSFFGTFIALRCHSRCEILLNFYQLFLFVAFFKEKSSTKTCVTTWASSSRRAP